MTTVRFTVAGDPVAQGSKRHVGRGVLVESSKALRPWRQDVVAAAREALGDMAPLVGPVNVVATFYVRRPNSHFRSSGELRTTAPTYSHKRPDVDKLLRAICDACTTAGVWLDDSQVAMATAVKAYVVPGKHPVGVDVLVETLNEREVAA